MCAQSCPVFATPWTVARQAPLSMGFPRQEYWSGLPFPSPGDLPNPGIKPRSPASLAGGFYTTMPPGKPKGAIMDPYKNLRPFQEAGAKEDFYVSSPTLILVCLLVFHAHTCKCER